MEHLSAASIAADRTLVSVTREDARNVRDCLLRDRGIKQSNVRRYINDLRAIFALGIREFSVSASSGNPFVSLQIRGGDTAARSARDERKRVPPELLPRIRERLQTRASADLWRIWRIVEGTGCRPGEVTGLAVADVHADASIPHIDLVPNAYRRLKNAASIRRIPLVGDGLVAMREALEATGDPAGPLFPTYGRVRGSDAASAILMKHVRAITDDPRIVVHSLRHSMEDRMTAAGVSEFDRNLVLGHASGGMSERYGGADASCGGRTGT